MIRQAVGGWAAAMRAALVAAAGIGMLAAASPAGATWSVTANNAAAPVPAGDVVRYWTAADTQGYLQKANRVVVDSAGNVYATGFRDNGTGGNFLTTKHDPAGNLLWEKTFNGGGYDEARAIAIDAAGNVYVAGVSYPSGTSDSNIVTIKYDGTGVLLWQATFGSGNGFDDAPVAIAVDSAGGAVYLTGTTANGSNLDTITIRYAAGSGQAVWQKLYPDAASGDADAGDDAPVGLALDSAGDVLVAGTSRAGNDDFVTIKYNAADGSRAWLQRLDTGTRDRAAALAVDGSDNVYVTGTSLKQFNDTDITTVKYGPAGGPPLWQVSYDTTTDTVLGVDQAAAIAVDGGQVYVIGQTGSVSDPNVVLLSYDAGSVDGALNWASTPYNGGGDDRAVALAAESGGNIYVAADSGNIGSHDIVVLKFDAAGAQQQTFTHDSGGDETAGGLALGQDGDGRTTIHVAGGSDRLGGSGQKADYMLVKFGPVGPDLTVESLSGPASGVSDGSITVSHTVRNVLDSRSGKLSDAGAASDLTLYLAPTPTPALSDLIPLGTTLAVPALASGAAVSADTTVAIPPASVVAPGTYWLAALVDGANAVSEQDEGNNLNVSATAITIVNPPDLVVTSVTGPASALAGATINVNYSIQNVRQPDAGAFDVAFVLSTNNVIGDGDDQALTGTDQITGLAGGAAVTRSASVSIPTATSPGSYYIGVIADSGNAISEPNETDNKLASTGLLDVQPIPDLVVTDVNGPLGGVAGSTISVGTTVQNNGAAVGGFDVSMYLSADATITSADTLLGSRRISALSASQSDTQAATVTIPGSVAQGVYYLGAIADTGAEVTESDETNNTAGSTRTISVGLAASDPAARPDLVITNVTGPTTVQFGTPFTVTTTVQNVLPKNVAGSFRLGIYLSTNSVIDPAIDLLIGERTISSLTGNTSDTGDVGVTLVSDSTESVVWGTYTGVAVGTGSLTKTAATGWGNAGAISAQAVPGDGGVKFTIAETNKRRVVGLSVPNTVWQRASVNYGFDILSGGVFDIVESGTYRMSRLYSANDVLSVERHGSTVQYFQNGVLFRTVTVPALGPLVAQAVLYDNGATVTNATIRNLIAPGTYYLGAYADVDNTVAEVDEANNATVQTGAGSPTSTTLGAVRGTASADGSGGGGALSWGSLIVLLLLTGVRGRAFRKPAA